MKRILTALMMVACWSVGGHASVKTDINQIIDGFDSTINIGIKVKDLTTDKVLYRRNANRWFIPASNMKLYSDAAALMMLGPDYRFKTELRTDADSIKAQTLQGNLYLLSQGDPSFSHQNLTQLMMRLSAYGIQSIQGKVILVNQAFRASRQAPGWMVDDLQYAYGSPITPVSLDSNRFQIQINPGMRLGKMALIKPIGTGGAVEVISKVKTVRSGKHCGLDYAMDMQNRLTASGCIGLSQMAHAESLAIKAPLVYFDYWLSHDNNLKMFHFKRQAKLGRLPSKTVLLAEHYSAPMSELIARTLKPSDNLYADSLFLKVGNVYFNRPATWSMAQRAVKRLLHDYFGMSMAKAVLSDGSGLSRYDLISPRQTVELLQAMHQNFALAYEFTAALPLSGRDGTLQKRLKSSHQIDLVRAKTGGMQGVVSLSGYLQTRNRHTLAFSMFINGIGGNSHVFLARYRQLEDKICNYLLGLKPGGMLARAKVGKRRKLLPYEQKGSHAYNRRQKKRMFNNLEFHLRKALANQAVLIIRKPHQIELNTQHISQKLKKKLDKLHRHYPFWVEIIANQAKLNCPYCLFHRIKGQRGVKLVLRDNV